MITRAQLRRPLRQRLNQIAKNALAQKGEPSSLLMARLRAFFLDTNVRAAAIYERDPHVGVEGARVLADQIAMFAPSEEIVEWYLKPKGPAKGFRPICKFGPEMKIRHKLIAAVVDAQIGSLSPFYDRPQTGTPKAIAAIKSAIEEIGPWVLVADIHNCFQSVNMDALYQIGFLPPEVIAHALDSRHLRMQREEIIDNPKCSITITTDNDVYHRDPTQTRAGPRGLLHGCSASNAILRYLLSAVLRDLEENVRIIVYVDNIFVIGGTEEICGRVRDELSCRLAACPGGPLVFGQAAIVNSEDGFDALGYHLLLTGDRVHCSLSDKNLGKLDDRLSDLVAYLLLDAEGVVDEVLHSFPAVDDDFRALLDDQLFHLRSQIEAIEVRDFDEVDTDDNGHDYR